MSQFVKRHARCRNKADTAFIGHGCSQPGCGQTDGHAALNDWHLCYELTYS